MTLLAVRGFLVRILVRDRLSWIELKIISSFGETSGYIDVGDTWMLLTICWWQFWVLVLNANLKRQRMLVTKTAKTVTNISNLSPKHFVSNIRHQQQCSWNIQSWKWHNNESKTLTSTASHVIDPVPCHFIYHSVFPEYQDYAKFPNAELFFRICYLWIVTVQR